MLVRNVAIAIAVAGIVAFMRHDRQAFLPVAMLALWPSLGGHYVELAFVNQMRMDADRSRVLPNTSFAGWYSELRRTGKAIQIIPEMAAQF
ncbi:MAG: hypothetical protein ACREIF_01960 [Chthoniobacterales bacterium]